MQHLTTYTMRMATVVGITNGSGLGINTLCGKYPNKSMLALYKVLIHFYSHLKQLYLSNETEYC